MELDGVYDRQPEERRSDEVAVRQAVAREFLRTHDDDYDFLVIVTRFPFSFGSDDESLGVRARYYGFKNDVQVIGVPIFDDSAAWGSASRMQGYIDMGPFASLVTDPLDRRFDATLSTLAHEVGHRWLSHARFRADDGSLSDALLGIDRSHWSFLLQSSNSVMYGNEWRDNGDGTFT